MKVPNEAIVDLSSEKVNLKLGGPSQAIHLHIRIPESVVITGCLKTCSKYLAECLDDVKVEAIEGVENSGCDAERATHLLDRVKKHIIIAPLQTMAPTVFYFGSDDGTETLLRVEYMFNQG